MQLLFCLLALALPPHADAHAPQIAAAGDLVVMDATKSVGDVFVWESLDGIACLPVDSGRRLVWASGRPGSYRFLLIAAGRIGDQVAVETAQITVRIEAPAPAPPLTPPAPAPNPTPGPNSSPIGGRLHATLIYTESDLTPELAALRADPTIAPTLAALDCQWSECESTSREYSARNLGPAVAGRALPQLVIQRLTTAPATARTARGITYAIAPAPVIAVVPVLTSADVIEAIKRLRKP